MEEEIVNVDFEFFGLKEVDFHGIKALLKQNFGQDADLLDLSWLADRLIAQSGIGTTVKIEDELDPYGLLTVLSLDPKESQLRLLTEYLISKSKKSTHHSEFTQLLNSNRVGLIINDRLINMPPQLVPPMLRSLMEEMAEALQDKKPFDFTHFVFISKLYQEVESTIDQEEQEDEPAPPKLKKRKKQKTQDFFYFQPEDEIIRKYADFSFSYQFSKQSQSSDSRRAFQDVGIEPFRSVMVVPSSKMNDMVSELESVLKAD